MRVRLLGSIDVLVDGEPRSVPGLRRRALLAALALQRGVAVDRDLLVSIVWNKDAPQTAANTLQSHVSYLRTLIGDRTAIMFRPPGYVFELGGDETDVESAERLIHQAARSEDLAERARHLREALALWRGPTLTDVGGLPWLEEQADRLEHLRMRATHSLLETRLELGEHAQLLPDLEQLVRDQPFDEQMHGHLILALYRAGRQVESLAAYQRVRRSLNDELGIDPSPALRALETAILRQDPDLQGPPDQGSPTVRSAADNDSADATDATGQHRPTPAQLPAPTAAFTGRHEHLARLDSLLVADSDDRPATLVISAIAGTAGVGKTTLAVQWAHRVRDRFADGQLFVDLQGYAAGPSVRPIDALTGFLDALGVPPEQAPVQVDQAAALYRTLVAGRRLLIVLDNARSAEQVRPLLPGEPGCLVLVTSRDRLSGLVASNGARSLSLDALSPDEAGELLARLLGKTRLAAEPKSTMELARTCAFLPLALRVAAATLAWQPDRRIADYVTQLRHDTLRTLTIEDDPGVGIRAAFDASYEALPVPARRLFRLLSLAPGPDIGVPAAAALGGLDNHETAALLDRLAGAHLLDQPGHDRYGWHDLLRAYAGERLAQEDAPEVRRAATHRLYDWYLRSVDAAADLLYPHMLRLPRTATRSPEPGPPRFANHTTALAWLDAQRRNMVAAVQHAAAAEPEPAEAGEDLRIAACLFADALRGYFHLRRHAADWLAVGECALTAATVLGDPRAQAAARHSLGTAYRCLGDLPNALRHYTHALRLSRLAEWPDAEATALANLGIVRQGQGRLKAAVGQLTRALAIDRQTGRGAGVANNLGNLASVYLDQGRLEEAAAHFAEALDLNRLTGNRHGQALALIGLGQAYRERGRLDDARNQLSEAMRHCIQVGDRDGQATVHLGLGAVDRDLGRIAEARSHALAALTLGRDAGDPRTEAGALIILASTLPDQREAFDHYSRAHKLALMATVPRVQIEALIGLASAALQLGELELAAHFAESAVNRANWSGYRVLEGDARNSLARTQLGRAREFCVAG
jgi:DNA-binding SARP family transcriptional activator/tetratricopeptide (TPR) repeat protein